MNEIKKPRRSIPKWNGGYRRVAWEMKGHYKSLLKRGNLSQDQQLLIKDLQNQLFMFCEFCLTEDDEPIMDEKGR